MLCSVAYLVLLLQFLVHVTAYGTNYENYEPSRFFYACQLQLGLEATFCSPENVSCPCLNPNYLASMAGCIETNGGAHDDASTKASIKSGIKDCTYYGVTLNSSWYDIAINDYHNNAKSASEIANFNMSDIIDVPFIVNHTASYPYQESYRRFYANYQGSLYYGAAILGFWLIVLLVGGFINWSKILFPQTTKKMTSPLVNYWRKHVTVPATFRKKKAQDQPFLKVFGFLIPSRFESLILALFYGITILCNALNMEGIDNDPLFNSRYAAENRYVADRSGITATMFMPLIFLFAGRNNFLQWLTRWNYSTFLAFHRHTSRVMVILVIIHSFAFTYAVYDEYAEDAAESYFYWGIVGTIAGGLILVQAILFLRRNWYELFLFLHVILAALWVLGTWLHLVDMGYIQMVYPAVAVWVFDRLVRIVRLFIFGFPKADVYLLADETLKVVIPKPSYWKSIPGGHAFIHFLKPTYFWQSHPFTFTDGIEDKNAITLYCKVKGGITHSLYKMLVAAPGRQCKVRVAVEGPYGEATPAKYADTAVFVAGGNGIPGIYSEIIDIAKHTTHSEKQSLKLYWVIREWRSLFWFYEELVNLNKTNIQTTIYVTRPDVITCIEDFSQRFTATTTTTKTTTINSGSLKLESNTDASFEENENEKQETLGKDMAVKEVVHDDLSSDEKSDVTLIINSIKNELSHITFLEGRPDFEKIVPQEIHESNGSVTFVTCGHPAMVDELRYCCAHNVDNKERKRVDFFEQIQVWA
ncbi:hypothetical protein PVL30_003343 [Lodderomyces elongisporus]|uniref:uncharacterized protein n=1 Tax=Lodderomyces elongisporus TaxID=36914 RepID=UPI0029258985|nr:uncharacterized protein PVL30_003343 [Lodderomyces elongisporus]WLF79587.1 hypothetical protein PVL30_003343 [Lodderomyces elongisporus]